MIYVGVIVYIYRTVSSLLNFTIYDNTKLISRDTEFIYIFALSSSFITSHINLNRYFLFFLHFSATQRDIKIIEIMMIK